MSVDSRDNLTELALFSGLTREEIGVVEANLGQRTLKAGALLFSEGDPGNDFFILVDGRVRATIRDAAGEDIVLSDFAKGDFFGEMSMIEGLPRSATCHAIDDARLLSLGGDALERLMSEHSAIAEKILYRMILVTTSRLDATGTLISEMVKWGEAAQLRAVTDEGTGLYNRRFLDSALQTEFRKAITERRSLSVAMVDIDRFGALNREYGESFCDETLRAIADAFRKCSRAHDTIARDGGDEFAIVFPDTDADAAMAICQDMRERISELTFQSRPEARVTASFGVAALTNRVASAEALKKNADVALYQAKDEGRNRAVLYERRTQRKLAFASIAERERTVERILRTIADGNSFLLLGHELPDEDCIASLVSMALLIAKFGKPVSIYIHDQIPDQLSYMANICAYNKIDIVQGEACALIPPDIICVLDTPKPDMISLNPQIKEMLADPKRIIVELDHHLSADAAYAGTDGYCLVHRASSTCELIGFLCCKLERRKDLLSRFGIEDLFSRNLVLCMLTGMIGDTRFGLTLKNNRDIFFYRYFSKRFASRLRELSHKNSNNYSSMKDIFNTIQTLSTEEKNLYQMILEHAHFFGRTGYVILEEDFSRTYQTGIDYSLFVKVIKSITDFLSEKSGTIGLSAYYDLPEVSDLIQFRIRTSREVSNIDLRSILTDFGITDGGGHAGAIGFRVPKKDVPDVSEYVAAILRKIETL